MDSTKLLEFIRSKLSQTEKRLPLGVAMTNYRLGYAEALRDVEKEIKATESYIPRLTISQMTSLEVGDKVIWLPNNTLGTIIEFRNGGIYIIWDDGVGAWYQFGNTYNIGIFMTFSHNRHFNIIK